MKINFKRSLSLIATSLLLGVVSINADTIIINDSNGDYSIDSTLNNTSLNINNTLDGQKVIITSSGILNNNDLNTTININANYGNGFFYLDNDGSISNTIGNTIEISSDGVVMMDNNGIINSNSNNYAIKNDGQINLFNNGSIIGKVINNGQMTINNKIGGVIFNSIDNYDSLNITNYGDINNDITNHNEASLYYTSTNGSFLGGDIINNGNMNYDVQHSVYNVMHSNTITNNGNMRLNVGSHYLNDYIANETSVTHFTFSTNGNMQGTNWTELNGKNITFKDGSTINIVISHYSTNTEFLANQSFIIVKASNELDVQGVLNITDNSALLNFSTNYTTGKELSVVAVSTQTVSDTINNPTTDNTTNTNPHPKTNDTHKILAQYTNAQGAGQALDSIIANQTNYSAMDSFVSKLNTLSTNNDVAKAVESTTPVSTSSAIVANTQIMNNVTNIVSTRQSTTISGTNGMNSGDIFSDMFVDNNLWIKTFGSIGSQNNKDGMNGFDLKTYGLGFGADTKYKSDKTFGLGFFYTNANVDVNNMDQSTDLDVFTTVVYGSTPIIDNRTNFLYQVGYTLQKNNSSRGIALTGDVAEADYTTKIANLDLKLQRDYQITKELLLQPYVGTSYKHITNPSYSESGAGALNLNVDKFTTSELVANIGTDVSYSLDKVSKLTANVGLGYDLQDKKQIVTSSYAGATGVSFDTLGIDNGRYSYEAGIGYDRNISKTTSISVNYNYQAEGTDFSNNVVSAKYTLNF